MALEASTKDRDPVHTTSLSLGDRRLLDRSQIHLQRIDACACGVIPFSLRKFLSPDRHDAIPVRHEIPPAIDHLFDEIRREAALVLLCNPSKVLRWSLQLSGYGSIALAVRAVARGTVSRKELFPQAR